MRKLVILLVGIALFLYGLMTLESSIHWIIDTSDVMVGFVLMVVGALVLSVEMSRW
jgi:SNF family Na+-dependent transporter